MTEKIDIKSLNFDELKALISDMGGRAFRTEQIYKWLHQKAVTSFDEMTNLSKDFREKLNNKCTITCLNPVKILTSKIDGTKKFLFQLKDGNVIESVLMKYHYGNSV